MKPWGLSPSLTPRAQAAGPAYELKFLVEEETAARVGAWAGERLEPDPYGDASGSYQTTTLYLDTPELDVFHGAPGYQRRKYRLRRYGAGPAIYLERKTKKGDRVAKRRCAIPEAELGLLAAAAWPDTWDGAWFGQRAGLRRLSPAWRVWYRRTAWIGPEMRLTMDREVRGVAAGTWAIGTLEESAGAPAAEHRVILELKFRTALPAAFKECLVQFGLTPSAVSKYRLCRGSGGGQDPGRA